METCSKRTMLLALKRTPVIIPTNASACSILPSSAPLPPSAMADTTWRSRRTAWPFVDMMATDILVRALVGSLRFESRSDYLRGRRA